ncbi:hypothetical protein ACTAF0_12410 [Streptomyces murinus]|uniref:hypothetical protein n=1 Tax=Streptomyces murinus TaxID=33900 RepID=UPI003F48A77B
MHDWFVLLVAVLDEPPGEGHPAAVHRRPGGGAPGPAATEAGRALADRLGVPFHFASPDTPDEQAPRRRETRWAPARCLRGAPGARSRGA